MNNLSLRSLVSVASLFLGVGLVGCGPSVEGHGIGDGDGRLLGDQGQGGTSDGGDGWDDPGNPGTGGSDPGVGTAIALLASQMNWGGGEGGNTSTGTSGSTGPGGGPDPATLYLQFGNDPQSCSDASLPSECEGVHWQVSIGIPPSLQQVGLLQLSNEALISNMFASGGDGTGAPDGACWGGGGSFTEGTLDILSIDSEQVVFRLAGTTAEVFTETNVDGDYSAPRCQ